MWSYKKIQYRLSHFCQRLEAIISDTAPSDATGYEMVLVNTQNEKLLIISRISGQEQPGYNGNAHISSTTEIKMQSTQVNKILI